MATDPTDTGGLFAGRRPDAAPARFRKRAGGTPGARREFDKLLAGFLLAAEVLLCLTLFGPQPLGWLWVGSQVEYQTGAAGAGLVTILIGCLTSLMVTLVLAKRIDNAWKLVRRAAGHEQDQGALERIFATCAVLALIAFSIWFLLIHGPAPTVAPTQ